MMAAKTNPTTKTRVVAMADNERVLYTYYRWRTQAEISAESVARRRQAFALYLAGDKTVAQIARQMGVTSQCVWRWVRREEAARGLQVSRVVSRAVRVEPVAVAS